MGRNPSHNLSGGRHLLHIVHPTMGRNPSHNLSGGRHLLQVTNSITYSTPYYGLHNSGGTYYKLQTLSHIVHPLWAG